MDKQGVLFLLKVFCLMSCQHINQMDSAKPILKGEIKSLVGIAGQQYNVSQYDEKDDFEKEIEETVIPAIIIRSSYGLTDKNSVGIGFQSPTTFFIKSINSIYKKDEKHYLAVAHDISYSRFKHEINRASQKWIVLGIRNSLLYTYELSEDFSNDVSAGFLIRKSEVVALNELADNDVSLDLLANYSFSLNYKWAIFEMAFLKSFRSGETLSSYALGLKFSFFSE